MAKIKLMPQVFAIAIAMAFALPALAAQSSAAQSDNDEIATLKIEGGVIMVSHEGGEFASGMQDQRLFEKDRLMVSEDSKAKVEYDEGCDETYDEPGVYELDSECAAALWGAGDTQALTAGLITTGVIIAWILYEHDDDGDRIVPPPPPPVSR